MTETVPRGRNPAAGTPPWSTGHGQFLAIAGRVVEAAPNAMIVVDHRGKIVFASARTEAIFGYARSELFGQTIEMLVPRRLRRSHRNVRTRFTQDPRACPMGADRRVVGVRKDGTEVVVEVGLSPIALGGDQLVLSSIVDISDKVALEESRRVLLDKARGVEAASQSKEEAASSLSDELRASLRCMIRSLEELGSGRLDERDRTAAIDDLLSRACDLDRALQGLPGLGN